MKPFGGKMIVFLFFRETVNPANYHVEDGGGRYCGGKRTSERWRKGRKED